MADATKLIASALAFVTALRRDHPEIGIASAQILLLVADRPDLSLREIAEACDLAPATNSRLLAQLSAWQAFEKPGLGLIEMIDDPRERRRKIVRLTPAGQTAVGRLLKPLV